MKHRTPIVLTERQKCHKLVFCLTMTAVSIVITLWGFAWTLAAAGDGAVSVLHLCALIVGSLMARTFARIADRT